MQYGFLIDQRRCIGCHACTVACKSENDVPIGDFRTWVKYTERGNYPDVKRHFTVLRCNQCSNPPCVRICPVTALSKGATGIVDIDREICIGCRACMQACPYDALYLNDDSGSVEKCHYCAHRVDRGIEPACVVVCPEEALISGDLHDPNSRVARMVKELDTEVRRPEQETRPNVHYIGHEKSALKPGRASTPPTYIWSDRQHRKPDPWPDALETEPDLMTVLDTEHKIQWGWRVALYLVTKGLAGGAAILAPFAAALGLTGFVATYLPEVLALVFLTITTIILVEDLTRPRLFLTLITRGNPRSWLVRGAWILSAFGAVVSATLLARICGFDAVADNLRWPGALVGVGVAGYTSFLFRQCEGRDLWQSGWTLPHMLFQSLLLGASCFAPFANGHSGLAVLVAIGGVGHVALAIMEWKCPRDTENAHQAAAFLGKLDWGRGPGSNPFLPGLALVLLSIPAAFLFPVPAILLTFCGVFLYEWTFIRAGQLAPLT